MPSSDNTSSSYQSLKNLILVAIGAVGSTQMICYACACNTNLLHAIAMFTILVQLVVYIHASGIAFGNEMTEKYYDLTGSCTYTTTVLLSASIYPGALSSRQKLLNGLVIIWALRLGIFLFHRISTSGGEDSRFIRLKQNRFRFAIPWVIQGVWVFLTALPIFIINSNDATSRSAAFSTLDWVGLALWILGFVVEVLADGQKSKWRKDPCNKDKFINTGLWAISRHPNYFGEMTLWIGFFVVSFSSLSHSYRQLGCAMLSPLFVCFLLITVSGIPLLERASDKKWGDDAIYKKYKESVPVLIPYFGRAGAAKF